MSCLQKLYLLSHDIVDNKASTFLAAWSSNIHYQAQSAYRMNEDNAKQYLTCGPPAKVLMGLSEYFVCRL